MLGDGLMCWEGLCGGGAVTVVVCIIDLLTVYSNSFVFVRRWVEVKRSLFFFKTLHWPRPCPLVVSHPSNTPPPNSLVPHMTDLFFLFGTFDILLTKAEVALGSRMRSAWTSFAENYSIPSWAPYDNATRAFNVLNTGSGGPRVLRQWKQAQCDLIDTLRRRR